MAEPARSERPRILFVQPTEAAAYPPLINAAVLLAEAGWEVTVASAPIAGKTMAYPEHPLIRVRAAEPRPSHALRRRDFARYTAGAAWMALRLRPDVVYASDPGGAGPGLLAARLSGAKLVYHEHDSPAPGAPSSLLRTLRRRGARAADLVVFPNRERGLIAQDEMGFEADRLQVVWNVPRRAEVLPPRGGEAPKLVVYYHGSITPQRLPESVVRAVGRFGGAVRLLLAGYEAPGGKGYVQRLVDLGRTGGAELVSYGGLYATRAELLRRSALADVGMALMPMSGDDVNMGHMTGASNKVFDYMAAGVLPIVSALPAWENVFVEPGCARACDPDSVESLVSALAWYLDDPARRSAMRLRNREKILSDWNYDSAFAPVIDRLREFARRRRKPA